MILIKLMICQMSIQYWLFQALTMDLDVLDLVLVESILMMMRITHLLIHSTLTLDQFIIHSLEYGKIYKVSEFYKTKFYFIHINNFLFPFFSLHFSHEYITVDQYMHKPVFTFKKSKCINLNAINRYTHICIYICRSIIW